MKLVIGKRITLSVDSIEQASDFYCSLRRESQEGSSTFPEGKIKQGNKTIATVFYNGRVYFEKTLQVTA